MCPMRRMFAPASASRAGGAAVRRSACCLVLALLRVDGSQDLARAQSAPAFIEPGLALAAGPAGQVDLVSLIVRLEGQPLAVQARAAQGAPGRAPLAGPA